MVGDGFKVFSCRVNRQEKSLRYWVGDSFKLLSKAKERAYWDRPYIDADVLCVSGVFYSSLPSNTLEEMTQGRGYEEVVRYFVEEHTFD